MRIRSGVQVEVVERDAACSCLRILAIVGQIDLEAGWFTHGHTADALSVE